MLRKFNEVRRGRLPHEEIDKEVERIKELYPITDYASYAHLENISADIHHLDELAKEQGIFGTYMTYICDEEELRGNRTPGLYFVYGLDEEGIKNCTFDMHKVINRQKHYPGIVFPQVTVMKIGDKDAMLQTEEIIHNCYLLEGLRLVCQEFSYSIPTEIGYGELTFLANHYYYMKQPNAQKLKKAFREMLQKYLRNLLKKEEKKTFFEKKYDSFCYSNRNYTSGKRTKKSFRFLWYCFFGGNKVGYKTILERNDSLSTLLIEKHVWKAFKENLRQYPDCTYAICPGRAKWQFRLDPAINLKGEDKENPKRNLFARIGDRGYERIRILVPTHWMDVVSHVYTRSKYQGYGGMTCEEMMEEGNYAAFCIPEKYYVHWHNSCIKENILYAFDLGAINYYERRDAFDIPVLVRDKDAQKAAVILKNLMSTFAMEGFSLQLRERGNGYCKFIKTPYEAVEFTECKDKRGMYSVQGAIDEWKN